MIEVEFIVTFVQLDDGSIESENDEDLGGYSIPLCSKIVDTLCSREEKFHIRTTCVLGHNTKRDSDGNTYPIFNGFVVSFCFQIFLFQLVHLQRVINLSLFITTKLIYLLRNYRFGRSELGKK